MSGATEARGFRPLSRVVATVTLAAPVARDLRAAAPQADEECGGLVGRVDRRVLTVMALVPCTNADRGDAFALSLRELFGRHRPRGADLVGLYHTHPRGEPVLSALDRHYLAVFPWVWLLVGRPVAPGADPAFAAFVWRDGSAAGLPVTVAGRSAAVA